ncbi:winged helix-turn-helix domain-containing protein [uncultured Nocardioides sp.]|jgi:predicted ArsR family transcriptional regulator|uniref:winged helix-turn-helix domain-containing protein n=1 Tax=uncultured Nocardioides sp. TaxID=198441 RepID=UPI0023B64BEB
MPPPDDWTTPGPEHLKALTHPVRVRMLGMLRIDGPATATTLARRLGLNSGATSYHLRQLATHGFIEDDEEHLRIGRERWWRATSGATRTPGPDVDPGTTDAYLQAVVTVLGDQVQQAVRERPLLPEVWRDASDVGDWVVRITPAKATAVREQIAALLQDIEEDDDESAEQFVFQHYGFPLPGRLTSGQEHA